MSGYLEAYGAGEEERAKRITLIKRASALLVLLLVAGGVGYVLFKNYPEEQRAKALLDALRKQDYRSAYAMWGCSEATPCRDYSFQKFMDDWGPKSQHGDAASAHIGASQSCGTGVILRLDFKGSEAVPLWVERSTHVVSYAPWPECPGRHLHLGTFLRSLFGR